MTGEAPGGPKIGLIDYAWVIGKRWRLIGSLGAAACLLSLVVSLLLPKVYAASASVLPPQQLSVLLPGAAGQGGLGGSLGSLLGQKSVSELWVGILRSRTVADAIINRFALKERGQTREEARDDLAERVDVGCSREGIVSVTVEDEQPARSADLANAFVEELRRVVTTSGGRTRAFVEQRLDRTRQALNRAEDVLKGFQERNRAVQIDAQSAAIIDAFGKLKATLAARRVELNTLLSQVTASHPRVKLLESEIAELGEQLREMEEGGAGRSDIFLPTDRVPDLGVRYGRLVREVKYQETLFELLSQQYEMARVQEAKDTPTVQALDVAATPEEAAKPKRKLIVLLSTALALTAGVLAAFFLEYLEARGLWPRRPCTMEAGDE